ncbi:MAG: insulinase family protein [Phycisphaerales bacterium]|nr:insulinase family protein [Phycisphaerales bacterium]
MTNPRTDHPFVHRILDCGLEMAVLPLPGRPVVAMEIRLFAGFACEDPKYLGVTHVLNEAISKGTAHYDGRGLNDAFDEIGATHVSQAGRETFAFSGLCLPEYLPRSIALHAELIRRPTFPEDACSVAVELARQQLLALDDDPDELTKKLLYRQTYGQPLGRHVLGEPDTLARLNRDAIVEHWRSHFSAGRMYVAVAGGVDPDALADQFEKEFEGFHTGEQNPGPERERPCWNLNFAPVRRHYSKELEQEQIAICFPGSAVTDPDFYSGQVLIGVLSGGMSGRLFTEVREKQGLVYWVGAWSDHPRGAGFVHLGASSTPQNAEKTYNTLLREIDRLADDLTQQELERAQAGIVTRALTRGEVTRSKAAELCNDLFHHGRPLLTEEKLSRIQAVTLNDLRRYLEEHPRDRVGAVTLGPREIEFTNDG